MTSARTIFLSTMTRSGSIRFSAVAAGSQAMQIITGLSVGSTALLGLHAGRKDHRQQPLGVRMALTAVNVLAVAVGSTGSQCGLLCLHCCRACGTTFIVENEMMQISQKIFEISIWIRYNKYTACGVSA